MHGRESNLLVGHRARQQLVIPDVNAFGRVGHRPLRAGLHGLNDRLIPDQIGQNHATKNHHS